MCSSPVLAAVLAALAFAAPALAADPPAYAGTLSGSVKGNFACIAGVRPGDAGQRFFFVTPKDTIDGVPTYQPGSFELPLPVAPGTYSLETLGLGMASVAAEGGTVYSATKTTSQRGEVTLVLRSVKADPARTGAYVVHGTYRARLVPVGSGKTGEVVVEVRF